MLSKISIEEQKNLTALFDRMMHRDHFSYTLFGDKAVSLSGDFKHTPYENVLWMQQKCGGIFWKNWSTWERYQDFFPINNYLFIKELSITCPNVENIVFINKKAFINTVNNNIDTFKSKLKRNITGEELLAEIVATKHFAPIIKNNEILWGILLGYGLHNATLYQERLQLEQILYPNNFPGLSFSLTSSKELSVIEKKYEEINSRLVFFGDPDYSPLIASSVHFVADPEHEETKALSKKYEKLRRKISANYATGNFLEITFSQLISAD